MSTYPGGKEGEGVWQRIVNLMPPHTSYVELFAGGGAILRHKKPAPHSEALDLDEEALARLEARYRDLGHPEPIMFSNVDALEWLRAARHLIEDTLLYADPPYPLSARRTDRCHYKHEMTDEQHVELLELLTATRARVMVSCYRCPIYDAWLSDWNRVDYLTMTRGGVMVPESLWTNFSPPAELHGYEHVGEDYRERERIKRKRRRWLANFAELPDHERGAIFSDLENFIKQRRQTT